MIESVMVFALGFLTASLLALALIPVIHARATRFAARRILVEIPVSMGEIYADRDALRAEFAIARRRLEMRIEELTARMADQMVQLGKKSDELNRLKIKLAEKEVRTSALAASTSPTPESRHETAAPSSGSAPPRESSLPSDSPTHGSLRQQLAQLSELNPDLANSPLVPSGSEVPSTAYSR